VSSCSTGAQINSLVSCLQTDVSSWLCNNFVIHGSRFSFKLHNFFSIIKNIATILKTEAQGRYRHIYKQKICILHGMIHQQCC
jgi:hypothetical protein